MDFFDDQSSGGAAFEGAENDLPHHGTNNTGAGAAQLNIDGAVSQTIARAIRDATQTADPARQREAASWLLICCPDIAEQVDLPDLHVEAMATLAAAYFSGAASPLGASAASAIVAAHNVAGAHAALICG